MPRIPKQPECECHVPVGASEDIKLKVMEEKLRAQIPGIKDILYDSTYVNPEGRKVDRYKITYTNDKAPQYLDVPYGKDAQGGHDYYAGDGILLDGVTFKFSIDWSKVPTRSEFSNLKEVVGDASKGLVKDVEKTKADIVVIQGDITEIRTDVTQLNTEVEQLKEEVEDPDSGLLKRILALETRLTQAEARMSEIEEWMRNVKLDNIAGTIAGEEITL